MIVNGPKEKLAAFIEERCPWLKYREPYQTIGCADKDGRLLAVLVFQSKTANDVEISVAATNLPRSLLRAAYRYAVLQLGCGRVTFRTRSDNQSAIKAMGRLGAKEEGRQRGFFGDADAVMFGILAKDYPYGH